MDGRRQPDPQKENGNDLNDEDVIDLTQIIEGGDGYDVIELNDILERPDQALEAVVEPVEEETPLVNAIPTEETADLLEDSDDEIIDLTEATSALKTTAIEPAAESAPVTSEDEIDEAVIDLMDVATTLDADLVDAKPEAPATKVEESVETTEDEEDVIDLMDVTTTLENDLVDAKPEAPATKVEESVETTEDEEDVIDLMDVATTLENDPAETGLQGPSTMSEETAGSMEEDEPIIDLLDAMAPQTAEAEITVDKDDEFTDLESRAEAVLTDTTDAFDYETPEEAAETAGPDSDFMVFQDDEAVHSEAGTSPDVPESAVATLAAPMSPSVPVPLTEAQVEAALERTIEKIYGEKIEQLMIRAIEKTVTREISRIKNALLEDDDMVG